MKIAVLFCGLFRNGTSLIVDFIKWLESEENIDNVDIYIHTWWDPEYVNKRTTICGNAYLMEGDPRELLKDKLVIKKMKVEKQAEIDMSDLPYNTIIKEPNINRKIQLRESSYFTALSGLLSTKRCLELIDDIYQYDLIIKTRSDLFLDDIYNFDIIKEDIKKNNIWFADGRRYGFDKYDNRAFYGNPQVMAFYIYNNELAYRSLIKGLNMQIDCIWIYYTAKILKIEPMIWSIPLNISRNHLLKDNSRLDENPYWWNLIPKDRLNNE